MCSFHNFLLFVRKYILFVSYRQETFVIKKKTLNYFRNNNILVNDLKSELKILDFIEPDC